jgi:hypothetical protein
MAAILAKRLPRRELEPPGIAVTHPDLRQVCNPFFAR